jgi:hypothetical protein
MTRSIDDTFAGVALSTLQVAKMPLGRVKGLIGLCHFVRLRSDLNPRSGYVVPEVRSLLAASR